MFSTPSLSHHFLFLFFRGGLVSIWYSTQFHKHNFKKGWGWVKDGRQLSWGKLSDCNIVLHWKHHQHHHSNTIWKAMQNKLPLAPEQKLKNVNGKIVGFSAHYIADGKYFDFNHANSSDTNCKVNCSVITSWITCTYLFLEPAFLIWGC